MWRIEAKQQLYLSSLTLLLLCWLSWQVWGSGWLASASSSSGFYSSFSDCCTWWAESSDLPIRCLHARGRETNHKKSGTSNLSEMSRGPVWGMLSTLSDPFTEWPQNLAILSRAQNERKPFKKSRLLWQQLCHHIIQKVQWYLRCQWQELLVRVGQRRHSCAAFGGGVKQQQFYSSYCCLFSAVPPPAWGSSWVCKESTPPDPSSSSSNSYGHVCVFSSLMTVSASSRQPCNQSQTH